MSNSADHDNTNREDAELKLTHTARDWVIRLASGEIQEEELNQFKTWLTIDPSHQEAFDRERSFWQKLDHLEGAEGWKQEDQDLWGQPDIVPSPARRRFRYSVIVGGLTAACLAVVLLYQDIKMFLIADYHTSVGQQHVITLPDGGTAYLNTDTAIAVSFSHDERRIDLLQGEAFFDVVPNRQQPFRVFAQDGVTQAVGTAFVVDAHARQTTVTVTEGAVAVFPDTTDGIQPGPLVRVRQGEQTVYRHGEAPQTVETIDSESVVAWVQGNIMIDGQPFAQAMAELDRYRPGRIVLLADLSNTKPVSGRFTLDGIDEAITALAATQGLTVMRLSDYLVFIL